MDFKLSSEENISGKFKSLGIFTWSDAISFVQNLAYGRNENRTNFLLVLSELKGSCSSKHALLKELALENNQNEVQLYIGIYKMNAANTPGISNALQDSPLAFVPEAHCYLKIDGVPIDVTSKKSDYQRIAKSVMVEIEIKPSQVSIDKVNIHQQFIKQWIAEHDVPLNFSEVWNLREQCIQNLSNKR